MKRRLLAALAALVLLPLGLLSWLGFRAAGEEYGALRQTYRTLMQERLSEIDRQIAGFMSERRSSLRKLMEPTTGSVLEMMENVARDPFLIQFFVQASDGRVLFPASHVPLSESEKAFLVRTQSVFDQKILLAKSVEERSMESTNSALPASFSGKNGEKSSPEERYDTSRVSKLLSRGDPSRGGLPRDNPSLDIPVEDGWYTWYADADIRLLYWRRTPDRGVIGGELSRIRLLSEIIGLLPETTAGDLLFASGSVALNDSQGRTLYRWGSVSPQAVPLESIPLSPPFRSWSLQFVAPPETLTRQFRGGLWLQVTSGLALIGLTLAGLATFLYREHTRDLHEAEQRVTFVNQVSHELKTPLTNIRMYAELLEDALPEDDAENHRRLEVIITESRRLGRLIGNVLTFSKRRNGKLEMKPRIEAVDQRIRTVVDSFRPMLANRDLQPHLDLEAAEPCRFDPDLLEQILGNLIGNVEKYATNGRRLIIKSRHDAAFITLWVRDFGPGIPLERCDFVFEPFARLSERVDEGVAGTGIGLTIARDLARLHGGDLLVVFSNRSLVDDPGIPEPEQAAGCCFRARLAIIPA